jgi:hypothetical protein
MQGALQGFQLIDCAHHLLRDSITIKQLGAFSLHLLGNLPKVIEALRRGLLWLGWHVCVEYHGGVSQVCGQTLRLTL